ncbi:MAG: UDP-N-acetylmuramoyl-tripeptide--D-alanyl-D-alanine ligase [Coriobacteriia bacterium]|nr:UDP-N-acetylmuramoyl-tripeptide--D-alanyl-D-alanine ligase [Coriobacteriia bacterium]
MYDFSAADIAAVCKGSIIAGSPEARANSCSIDSRRVKPGSLFAAFVGTQVDGHDYLQAAVSGGATIVLVTDSAADYADIAASAAVIVVADTLRALQDLASYQRGLMTCPVIGITGSSGKTTTKELLSGALQLCTQPPLRVVATEGNYNNELGVPLTILAADQNSEVVVVEMGMRDRGQITQLAEIARPTIGIITTIGDAHIEMLGSRENIARAKGELFEALPADGVALMPVDVAYGDYLRSVSAASVLTVGSDKQADYQACELRFDKQGNAAVMVTLSSAEEIPLQLAIPGEHMVSNALLALAAAQLVGVEAQLAICGIQQVKAAAMRMQRCVAQLPAAPNVEILLDCYNANPESTAASLNTLAVAVVPAGALRVAVLGDMLELGDHSAKAHKDILLLAGLLQINLVYTLGEAYTQATQDVLRELSTGRSSSDLADLRSLTDRDLLIRSLIGALKPGSLVLIKGSRGMQMEAIADALMNADLDSDTPAAKQPAKQTAKQKEERPC